MYFPFVLASAFAFVSSIELALHLADYIFESQMWFFDRLVDEALDGVGVTGNVRQNTKRVVAYAELPDMLTADQVAKALNITAKATYNLLCKWQKAGYIERIAKGKYKKIVKVIV